MPSIRDNRGKPSPRENDFFRRTPADTRKTPAVVSMVEKLRSARELASQGKGSKYIAEKLGLALEEAKAVWAAVKGIELRRSHLSILKGNLRQMQQEFLPLAQAAYRDDPKPHNAHAMNAISNEIRCIIMDIEKLERPEAVALELIQGVFQPFLREMLRDIIAEIRKSQSECLAVSENPKSRAAVEASFSRMGKALGTAFNVSYAVHVEKMGIVLQCDLQELRKLASESKAALDKTVSDNNSTEDED